MGEWTFLTSHARVLSFIAKHPSVTALELSNSIGITERATRKIIADLEASGYISKRKVGRRNRYRIDPDQPMVLNNLAWLLVTSGDSRLRDNQRGLYLAKQAVALERNPQFLDTLAEAYFVNGFPYRAMEIIEEAVSTAEENKGYYEGQLKRFQEAVEGK